jgi:hypothetical protein
MKALYFADYIFYLNFGRTITGIDYTYYRHGPFSRAIYDETEAMQAEGLINIMSGPSVYGNVYYIYSATETTASVIEGLAEEEIQCLEYLINSIEDLSLEILLEAAYDTEPMRTAKQGERLVMKTFQELAKEKREETRQKVLNEYGRIPDCSLEEEDAEEGIAFTLLVGPSQEESLFRED